MKSFRLLLPLLLVIAFVTGCGTPKITNTPRNAVEQFLLAAVIERGVTQMDLSKYRGKKVALEYDRLEPQVDKAYLIGVLEMHLASNGVVIPIEKAEADLVIQPYCGVLATDDSQFLIGTPSLPIPLPNTELSFAIPEIAFFKKIERRGFGRFSLNILNAKTRTPIEVISGSNAMSSYINWTIMLFPFATYTVPIDDLNTGEVQYDVFE